MRQSIALRPMRIAGFLLLAAGCSDVVRPNDGLPGVAGAYLLESASGFHAPIAGSITLSADGHAERRVRFVTTSPTGASESVATGTFQLRPDGSLVFAFDESCGAVSCVWVVRAARTDDHFTLEYPDPADGPTIRETYARR